MNLRIENDKMYFYGYIWDGDGMRFASQFSRIDGTYPILEVHLHTYGGSVFDGNLIYNLLINAKSEIHTYVDGVAASMGFVLMLAGAKRYMAENAFAMSHEASGYTSGNAKAHESSANLLREIGKSFMRKLVSITGKSSKYCKRWLEGDNWFSAEQASEAGLITGIIGSVEGLDVEDDPTALTSNDIYARYVASSINKETPFKSSGMKNEVINKFNLIAVNGQSSDTSVIKALSEHIEAAEDKWKQKYQDEKKAREKIEKFVNAQLDARIGTIVNAGVKAGKITKAEAETYVGIGKKSGVEALEAVMSKMEGRISISDRITDNTPDAVREGWDWDRYQKENPQALEDMRKNDLENFKAIYKAKFKVDYKD